ncbi:E3 ubiquitin-protein ligase ZNRF1-like [Chrysemys picta bellii]|uniref:E3 ubiquitin-protein ligase ZNRF1-like n=1 Tax=Chrysemys picta bellii TaxID=8478 RepID=UPI0032B2AD92
MGGKQSTAARSRGPFPGVSTDDSAVPPPGGAPHFGHYRAGGGAMGLRSRSVSSVAGMGMDPSAAGGVPFGLYAAAARAAGDPERAPGGGGGGSGADSTYAHGNGYQETGGGRHGDGMLYLGPRASLADALPLHIAPRWFSAHSGESRGRRGDGGAVGLSSGIGLPTGSPGSSCLGTGNRKGGYSVGFLVYVRKRGPAGAHWGAEGHIGVTWKGADCSHAF